MIRAVLGTSGKPPLKAPGLVIHDKLALLDETVAFALKQRDSPLSEQLRKHLHRAVVRSDRLAEMTMRLHRFVKKAGRVLGRKGKTSDEVKADFDELLAKVRARVEKPKTPPRVASGSFGSVPGVARRRRR